MSFLRSDEVFFSDDLAKFELSDLVHIESKKIDDCHISIFLNPCRDQKWILKHMIPSDTKLQNILNSLLLGEYGLQTTNFIIFKHLPVFLKTYTNVDSGYFELSQYIEGRIPSQKELEHFLHPSLSLSHLSADNFIITVDHQIILTNRDILSKVELPQIFSLFLNDRYLQFFMIMCEERESFVHPLFEKNIPHIHGIMSGSELKDFLLVVKNLPEDRRMEIITKTKSIIPYPFSSRAFPASMGHIDYDYSFGTLFDALLKIPHDQYDDVISQMNLLISSNKSLLFYNPYDIGHIINSILNISVEQRNDLIKLTKMLLSNITSSYETTISDIIKIVLKFPKDQRNYIIIKLAELLLCQESSLDEIEDILKSIVSIPHDQRESIIEYTQVLFSRLKISNCGYLKDTLETVANIPNNQRENIVIDAVTFVQNENNICVTLKIMRIFSTISQNERKNILELVSLIKPELLYDAESIVRTILTIPKENRKEIVEKVQSLFCNSLIQGRNIYKDEFPDILNIISTIPIDQCETVFNNALFLTNMTTYKGSNTLFNILETIIAIPENQLQDVIFQTKSLLSIVPRIDSGDRLEIYPDYVLKAISDLSQDQRKNIVQKTIFLCNNIPIYSGNYYSSGLRDILKNLSQIPIDQIDDIIEKIIILTQDFLVFKEYYIANFIKIFAKIPLNDRMDVITKTKLLNFGRDIDHVLSFISTVTQDKRESFIEAIQPIFQDQYFHNKIWNYNMDYILKTISLFPQDEQKDVVIKAKSLVSDELTSNKYCSNLEFCYILKALLTIPVDQRNEIIEYAIPLIQYATHNGIVHEILEAIFIIPRKHRGKIISKTKGLISINPSIDTKSCHENLNPARILKSISNIPESQRKDVIKHAILIRANVPFPHDNCNLESILTTITNIHEKQRNDIVMKTQYLTKNLKKISRWSFIPSIMKSLINLSQDQREKVIINIKHLIRTDMSDKEIREIIQYQNSTSN